MYNERHVTHDAGLQKAVVFDDTVDGVTTDDNGDTSINWDDVERVSLETTDSFNTPPHSAAFDTSEFYRLAATVARPIPQPYMVDANGETSVVWLKKPRAELQTAAWSLDNRPWTLDHPDTGLVSSVDDVRGFWDDTYYNETVDDLKSHLHIPVDDDEAKSYIEEHGDVSVGFRNRVTAVDEYNKPVGGEGPDVNDGKRSDVELDGYQTDMYFDHVASVERGRCSSGDGCGLDGGYKGTSITNTDEATSVLTEKSQTRMAEDSKYVNPDDDRWYAVPPEDNSDDEWKFPITSCDGEDSVDSAWHFAIRERGDISISFETLKDRIRRRASELDCDMDLEEASEDSTDSTDNTMTDCNCNTDDDSGLSVDFDDLSPEVALDKLAAENDSIESYLTDLREQSEVAADAAEELDCDVDDVADTASLLSERVEDLSATVDSLQEPQKAEHAEFIAARTDRFGDEDELMELELDELEDKKELVEELASETSETTVNDDSNPDEGERRSMGETGYVQSPWE